MLRDFLHLLFPVTCSCCENVLQDGENYICISCLHSLPVLEDKQEPVIQKLAGRVNARSAYSLLKFNKLGMAQKLIHELKYNKNPEIGVFLGQLLAQHLLASNLLVEADFLVPIPLHDKKRTQRGYNQAEQIAKGVSETLQIPIDTQVLFKTKETESQTRKGRMARIANLQDCYEVKEKANLHGFHIVLIDDVVTTGATFEACSMALRKAGAAHISVLTLAVA